MSPAPTPTPIRSCQASRLHSGCPSSPCPQRLLRESCQLSHQGRRCPQNENEPMYLLPRTQGFRKHTVLSGDSATNSKQTWERETEGWVLYCPVCQEMPTLFHCVGRAHHHSGIEGLLTTEPVIVSGLKHIPSGLVVD